MERVAYRPAEVADMLGVDKQTVTVWLNKGVLKGSKVESCWFVNINEVRRVVGVKDNKPEFVDQQAEYRKWFAGLNEADKLKEIDRLLHS